MKRATLWILGIVATLALAVVLGIVIVATYDWNRAKPWLTSTLTQTLGRTVQVDGDLSVHWQRDADGDGWRAWLPTPHVSAGQVTVGNSKWARVPIFGHAKRVDFDLAVLPLFAKTVAIQTMRFVEPDAALERLDATHENWTFTDLPSTWTCTIGRIAIDRAKFSYFDHGGGIDIAGQIDALGEQIAYDELVTRQVKAARRDVLGRIGPKAVRRFEERADRRAAAIRKDGALQRYAFNWSATGSVAKQPFHGAGRLGGVFYLRNRERPFPLLGDLKIGDTHIVLVGTLTDPADLDALDLRLWLAGPNLSHIYAIAGVPLPNSGAYAMEGHLLGQFDAGTTIRYEDFTARIGQSDLSGSLKYEGKGPRPLLSGKIVSDELQFRDLAPLIGADSGGGAQDASAKLIPAEPFRPDRWRAMDANVEFTGDRVFRDSELPIHKVDTHITLDDGVLALAPLKFGYAGGDVDSTLRLDGSKTPIKASFKLTAHGMQLKELLPVASGDGVTLGTAQGAAQLDATGDSIGSLLGAASGELKVALDDGTVSKALLETASLNVPNIALAKLFGDQQVKIDCAVADFAASGGVFETRAFVIDTDTALIRVDGKVDLGRETIDLVVHPQSKGVRLLSLHSPLHVRGPFRDIDVSIDKGALLARAATAIGLAAVAPAAALVPLTSTGANAAPNRCEALARQPLQPVAKAGSAVKKR
jgi:uncharacterized protein involved in outer membrane biogenesis